MADAESKVNAVGINQIACIEYEDWILVITIQNKLNLHLITYSAIKNCVSNYSFQLIHVT